MLHALPIVRRPLTVPACKTRARIRVHRAMTRGLAVLVVAAPGGCADAGEGSPPLPADDGAVVPSVAPATPAVADPGVCLDAAYLCAGLRERDEPRVLRWADDTREIRVRIPRPPASSPAEARELQDAAASGIRVWSGKPFPIRVDRGESGDADIVVRWVGRLEGAELGRASTEWSRTVDGTMGMRVRDFVLALENPVRAGRALTPGEVRLTAAHEMGHALGLPHSDSDRDVMYPTNTATALSARDFSAMAALYRMENGALVPGDGP